MSPKGCAFDKVSFERIVPFIFIVWSTTEVGQAAWHFSGDLPRRDDAIKTIIYFKIWNTLVFQTKIKLSPFLFFRFGPFLGHRYGRLAEISCPLELSNRIFIQKFHHAVDGSPSLWFFFS